VLGSVGDAAFCVEDEAAGFYVDFAAFGGLCGGSNGRGFALEHFIGSGFGCDRRGYARAHERDFDRAGGGGFAGLLVVVELCAGDAIDAAAVFSVKLDLDIVKDGVVVFVLRDFGGVNAIAGVAPHGVVEGVSGGVGLNVESEGFGQVLQIEWIF